MEKFIKKIIFMINKLLIFLKLFLRSFSKVFYGKYFIFTSGHAHISDLSNIKLQYAQPNENVNYFFEKKFSKIVGSGTAISFASARMCFYVMLEYYEIGKGDEVIVNGATCSVMVNAIIRRGAKPIFSDIDPENFGSSLCGIKACVSKHTKLIVAQHSFGIPCQIQEICSYSKAIEVPVIEDCAVALDSKYKGITIGNFGEASIFSFDGTKPINCFMGGVLYTNNNKIFNYAITKQNNTENLPAEKIKAIYNRFIFNRKYLNLKYSKYTDLYNLFQYIQIKFFKKISPFLDDDFHYSASSNYPYPAKMPSFLALIGVYEVDRWASQREQRREMLRLTIELFSSKGLCNLLSPAYFNPDLEITPLRIIFGHKELNLLRYTYKNFLDIAATWFISPITATIEPLEAYGYRIGDCPISEASGKFIVNLPTNYSLHEYEGFLKLLTIKLNELSFPSGDAKFTAS